MASGQHEDGQYMQLIQQLINLQRENNELRGGSASSRSNTKKPDRPRIEHGFTDADWALFIDSWARYKQMCGLTDPVEIRNELRTACSNEVNRLLFDLVGPGTLNSVTEEQLLRHIQFIAVKGLHPEVHRHKFHNIRQQTGEGPAQFLAKLRYQARFCNFMVLCPNENCRQAVNYSEDMVAG